MPRPTGGLIVIVALTLSLCVVPLAAEVPPAGKVPKIGLLNISSATVNARPFEIRSYWIPGS